MDLAELRTRIDRWENQHIEFKIWRKELLRLLEATESLYYDETPLSRLSL